MKLIPVLDYIVIKPHPRPTQSEGGIYLPDTERELPQTGDVLAVGPGTYRDGVFAKVSISVGASVLFSTSNYDSVRMRVDGENLLVMHERDIMAIVEI